MPDFWPETPGRPSAGQSHRRSFQVDYRESRGASEGGNGPTVVWEGKALGLHQCRRTANRSWGSMLYQKRHQTPDESGHLEWLVCNRSFEPPSIRSDGWEPLVSRKRLTPRAICHSKRSGNPGLEACQARSNVQIRSSRALLLHRTPPETPFEKPSCRSVCCSAWGCRRLRESARR